MLIILVYVCDGTAATTEKTAQESLHKFEYQMMVCESVNGLKWLDRGVELSCLLYCVDNATQHTHTHIDGDACMLCGCVYVSMV